MRMIDRATAEAALEPAALVDHFAACHAEARATAGDILLYDTKPDTGATMLCRAAWRSGKALGIKFGPIMPANAAKGLPTVVTMVALFEGETGTPVAIIDGHPITNWKTAADSGLAQRHLGRQGAKRLLMVGAGTLAPYLVRAHVAVRPSLTEVVIFNRGRARAEALVRTLAGHGIQASIADSLEQAARQADVISTATLSEEPLIKGAWLKPGTHLDLVGAYLPTMREADVAAVTAGRLFVDNREAAIGGCGEFCDAFAAGRASEATIEGDLYDIVVKDLRRRGDEITVYKNVGGGHLDLMTAEFVAKKLGLM